MSDIEINTLPLIQTKLHRPPLPIEPVRRPRITGWLDQRQERPLTLVSAPAGYGKSTLISDWVESLEIPSAWISLDEYDNDLGVFLGYFIAAIKRMFPQKLTEAQALLGAPELPPHSILLVRWSMNKMKSEKHISGRIRELLMETETKRDS